MVGHRGDVRRGLTRPAATSQSDSHSVRLALHTLGAERVEAALLDFLCAQEEGTTQMIIDQTGLRQPEISVGMRHLMDAGWVEQGTMSSKGKGRPMHVYRLAVAQAAIRDHYIERGRHKLDTLKQALDAVKRSWL